LRRPSPPHLRPKFKSDYELGTVSQVVWWARDQIGADDPRRNVLASFPTSTGQVARFLIVGWSAHGLAVLRAIHRPGHCRERSAMAVAGRI